MVGKDRGVFTFTWKICCSARVEGGLVSLGYNLLEFQTVLNMHGGFDELLNTSMRRVRAELRIIVYPRCHALRLFITSSSGYLARYISTARFIRGELRTVGISSIPVLFFALSLHAKASVGSSNIAHGVGSIIFAYKSHHMTVVLGALHVQQQAIFSTFGPLPPGMPSLSVLLFDFVLVIAKDSRCSPFYTSIITPYTSLSSDSN